MIDGTETTMHLGERIRAAREARHMTQDHLALAAQVSRRTVIRAEKGEAVSSETYMAIASVLELAPEAPKEPRETDPLRAQIAALGERIVWEGAPDRTAWGIESGERWHTPCYLALGGLAIGGMVPYLIVALDAYETASWEMVTLCAITAGTLGALVGRVIRDMKRRRQRADLMPRTRVVITNAAFYRVLVGKDGGLISVNRTALDPEKTTINEHSRYVLWPWARVVDIVSPDGMDRVEGVAGLHGRLKNVLAAA